MATFILDKILDNPTIEKFINGLDINQDRKKEMIEKVPSFTNEEKVFLWKALMDIYQLDIEKERAVSRVKKYFEK